MRGYIQKTAGVAVVLLKTDTGRYYASAATVPQAFQKIAAIIKTI